MKRVILYIRQHLSLRLGIIITLIVGVVFSLLFRFLFYRCQNYIQRSAIDRAMLSLDNTAERINGIMDETEIITNFLAITTPQHLAPDSLLAFSRRTVAENPLLAGVAISMEPYFFPEMGRYYSAYSLRQGDSITTVREGPFEYFDAVWYKTPRQLGRSCWVDAYDDYNEGTLSSPDFLVSYCCPMRDNQGRYLGSVTTSLTLKWLSQMVTAIPDYPNSSAIVVGKTGTYLVHPDTLKLFHEGIFTDADPRAKATIDALGRDMIAGRSGMVETIVDNAPAYIFYHPLARTGWSIAIVCPKSDVFARLYKLVFIVWTIIGIGLLCLLILCYQIVRQAIKPLSELDLQAQHIAEGNFLEPLPESTRRDSIGRLTNSFIRMQRSLAESVSNIQSVNAELEQHNVELNEAYQLKLEANRQKTAFTQKMYHEIRTPLNIIGGFTQVLAANMHELPPAEVDDITARMRESAADLVRLTRELSEAATKSSEN